MGLMICPYAGKYGKCIRCAHGRFHEQDKSCSVSLIDCPCCNEKAGDPNA